MDSTRTFDSGKLLLWAEQGLTRLSFYMETKVERYLKKQYRKDRSRANPSPKQWQHKRENRQLAKQQDLELRRPMVRNNITQRLSMLKSAQQEASPDVDQEL